MENQDRISRKALFGIMLGVVLVAGMMLALMAEGALRLRAYLKQGSGSGTVTSLFHTDEKSGLRVLTPGAKFSFGAINGQGFRGPEVAMPKPEGTIRIAFLGASTTLCAEVQDTEQTWPHLVTEALKKRFPAVKFDYINAGAPGYTVQTTTENLRHRVAKYRPDVIFIYHATNNFSKDVRRLAIAKGYVVERPEDDSWLSRNSLLWNYFSKQVRIYLRQKRAADETQESFQFDMAELTAGFRKDLSDLIRESASVAGTVAIATFAARLRRDLSDAEKEAAAVTAAYYMPHISIKSMIGGYEYYNGVIRDLARKHGVALIEGEGRVPADQAHYNDSVHFTTAGSQKFARAIIDEFAAVIGEKIRSGDLPAKVSFTASPDRETGQ